MAFAPSPINPVPPSLSSRRCLNTTRSKHQTELQFSCPTPGRRKHLNGARIYGPASISGQKPSTSATSGALGGAVEVGGLRTPDRVSVTVTYLNRWFSRLIRSPPAGQAAGGTQSSRPSRRKAKDASKSRPAYRRRRRVGVPAAAQSPLPPLPFSSTTNAARHARGTGGLRPRCAQVLRFRPAGYDARAGMSAGQSAEDQRGLQPGAGQPRPVSRARLAASGPEKSTASPFALAPFFDSIGGVEAFPQTRCPAPETANGEEANHVHRSQTRPRASRRFLRDPGLCTSARHDPHHRLRLFLCRARGRRHQARRPRRQADPRRQHRFALRLHTPICRPAAALGALPRARAADRRRAVERFRRPGAGRCGRHREDGARRIRRRLSACGEGTGEGTERASRSTNGRRASARSKRRAGTFTNTSSAATAISPRFFPPISSRWTRASSTRS